MTGTVMRALGIVVLALAIPAVVSPQAVPAGQGEPQVEAPAGQGSPAPETAAVGSPEPQGFTYDAEGRRDPFVSLVRSGGAAAGPAVGGRPAGLAGLGTAEVTLKGTIRSQDEIVGILLGADGRTYIVRPGDTLLDGTIQSVTDSALVVLQQVNDPLSLQTEREVRKTLRQADEAN